MSQKISFRFFNDREIRAVWDEAGNQWWFAVVDIVAAVSESSSPQNYWYVLKNRLKKAKNETLTKCKGFKLVAADGKRRLTDCLLQKDVLALLEAIPSRNAVPFIKWFTYSDDTIDGKSRAKAYALFESGLLASMKPSTVQCLKQIHAYLFGGLYDFAGQIRTVNISKGNFTFAPAMFLKDALTQIEKMPELKKNLKKCVDWSKLSKKAYLEAMTESPANSTKIRALLNNALTDKINDREIFMKGIDYSYYYESDDAAMEPDDSDSKSK